MITFSIIVPIYNNECYLKDLVLSLYNQSYQGIFEVIFLDDNSTDNSLSTLQELVKEYLEKKSNICVSILHDGENKKQGYRRNQGIRLAQGEWILFLDSDDYIHSETLQTCANRISNNPSSDMVMYNFGFVNDTDSIVKSTFFPNLYRQLDPSQLRDDKCEKLLAMDPYFTVNKVYRKQFLLDNDIYFGEGHFYEDFVFYVKSAVKATTIELLPNLFYFVRVHDNSTTKLNYDDTHTKDVYKAIEESCPELQEARGKFSQYHAIKYFVNRALLYSELRSNYTESQKVQYIKAVIDMIHHYIDPSEMATPRRYLSNLYYALFKIKYYQRNDAKNIISLYKLHRYKPSILKRLVLEHKRHKNSYKTRLYRKYILDKYRKFQPKQINKVTTTVKNDSSEIKPMILMLGFDYKYTGNSKYLFDELVKNYDSNHLKFVCKNIEDLDIDVDLEYFVEPNTNEFYDYLHEARVVIGESWIPLRFKLTEDQILIQLWHGQPFKKLLFDSYELSVMEWNPNTKQQKSLDISRWNYLISESIYSDEKFKTSLAVEQDKLLSCIYPRNQWLLNNRNNDALQKSLKEELGIPDDKKVILYLPTWRDYNFKQKAYLRDFDYLLEIDSLKQYLDNPEDYVFLVKGHGMDKELGVKDEDIYILDSNIDVQPYYLITDLFITDYSSALFDALLLDIPSYLIIKDFNYYNRIRGIYEDALADFEPVTAYSEKDLASLINSDYPMIDTNKYKPRNNINLSQFIADKLDDVSNELKD